MAALDFDTSAVAVWIDNRAGNNDPYAIRTNRTIATTFDTWRKLGFGKAGTKGSHLNI